MARKDKRGYNLRKGESQRKDGRYSYCYMDPTGVRRTIYATDLKELREKEKSINRELEEGIRVNPESKNMTVEQLFRIYISTRTLKANSRCHYEYIWSCYISNELGEMKVVQVKPSHIKLFYTKLEKANYSHNTLKLIHALLLSSFELAVADDIIRKNPAYKALNRQGTPQKQKKALSISQQQQLTSFAENSLTYMLYFPMIQIFLGTGCRRGELLALTWSDVDMEQKEIHITSQLLYRDFGEGNKFHISSPKTEAGNRTIPMNESVYEAFVMQKKLNFMQGIRRTVVIDGKSDFIFITKNGNPLNPQRINKILSNMVADYNEQEEWLAKKEQRKADLLPHITAHILRHTACTRMMETGINMKVIQHIMGHSDIGITMNIYTHIADQSRIKEELSKLDQIVL